MPALTGKHITVSDGLEGQDDHFETISSLWEELQLCAVDIATNPECDILSFAQSAFFLGVITLNRDLEPKEIAAASLSPTHAEPFMFDDPNHSAQSPASSTQDLGVNSASWWRTGSISTWLNPAPHRVTRDELVGAIEAEAFKQVIGLIYLATSPLAPSPPDQVGELNLGIILADTHRGKGYAREAIQLALKHAFDVRHCHRIQASLLHSSTKDRMVSLLTHMRFGHEGTKRCAFFNPMMAEWQDVTTLALLDTDWAMRRLYKSAPKSLWDELFLRHERERDELLRWEETRGRLKRGMTSSMETLRALPLETDSGNASDATSSASSASMSKGKKRALSRSRGDPYDGSNSDTDSEFSDTMFVRRYTPNSASRRSGASSPALSDASLESVPNSVTTTGSGSDWDMFDSGSSSLGDNE